MFMISSIACMQVCMYNVSRFHEMFQIVSRLRKSFKFPRIFKTCFGMFSSFQVSGGLSRLRGLVGGYNYWYQSISITISGRNTKCS